MTHDETMRLFKFMQGEFRKINLQFDDVKRQINTLTNAADAVLKQNETYMQEMLIVYHKVDRHESLIYRLAKAVGIQLSA